VEGALYLDSNFFWLFVFPGLLALASLFVLCCCCTGNSGSD
jgi:hypothetical protein